MPAVVQMTYAPADERLSRVEILDFEDLRRMNCGVTQRADFLVLGFVTAGTGSVTVDFAQHPLSPGSIVWVAPGGVHRWDDFERLQGLLVLCEATTPLTPATRRAVATPREPAVFVPTEESAPYVRAALEHLALETRADAPGSSPELHATLLTALLSRIAADEARDVADDGFARFRASLERDFRRHRDVAHYARDLGYAERTLTRLALAATGRTAKALIDERVALEAKRLLVHHGLSAAACSSELGFSDPSTFSSFFQRVTGSRPGFWRAARVSVD